jgi:hypothetical protein
MTFNSRISLKISMTAIVLRTSGFDVLPLSYSHHLASAILSSVKSAYPRATPNPTRISQSNYLGTHPPFLITNASFSPNRKNWSGLHRASQQVMIPARDRAPTTMFSRLKTFAA